MSSHFARSAATKLRLRPASDELDDVVEDLEVLPRELTFSAIDEGVEGAVPNPRHARTALASRPLRW